MCFSRSISHGVATDSSENLSPLRGSIARLSTIHALAGVATLLRPYGPEKKLMLENRRDFIRTGASGLAGAALAAAGCSRTAESQNTGPIGNLRSATPADLENLVGNGRKRRILLRGGVVLTLDSKTGDFEKADVLIDGKMIAEVAPNISVSD